MADDKIIVEITLDDGSIQKGFAKIETEAKKTGKVIGENLQSKTDNSIGKKFDDIKQGFSDLSASAVIAGGAIAASVAVVKKAFDFTVAGESIERVTRQFEVLAAREGISSSALIAGLERSADGLVDTTDLLEIANKGIIQFGASASQLPAILDIARQSSLVFGGTTVQKFEEISAAIANGSTKALKNAGIIIDTEKVYKDLANTLGITAGELNQQQKQQALLNAVIEKGSRDFQGITGSSNTATESFQRLNVSLKNVVETLEIAAAKNLGGFFARAGDAANSFAKDLNLGVKELSKQALTVDEAAFKMEGLIAVLGELEEKQKRLAENGGPSPVIESEILRIRTRMSELSQFIEDEQRKQITSINASADKETLAKITGLTPEQIAEIKKRRLDLDNFLNQKNLELDQANASNTQRRLQFLDQEASRRELSAREAFERKILIEAEQSQQSEIIEQQALQRKADVEKKFAENSKIATLEQEMEKNQLLAQIDTKRESDLEALAQRRIEAERKRVDDEKKLQQSRLQAYSSVFGQIATLQQNATGELAAVGKAAAISQATIDGYLAVQNAFATVPYPFNFAAAALVGVAAAANIAKIASTPTPGGGGGSAAFSPGIGGTGGGIGGGGLDSVPPTPIAAVEDQKPGTSIEVNIAGDVLDSQETGLRIVDLLNSAFDQQGVTVTG